MPRPAGGIDPAIETTAADLAGGEATRQKAGRRAPAAEAPEGCQHIWQRGHNADGTSVHRCASCGATKPR